jgi:hypothetical protein
MKSNTKILVVLMVIVALGLTACAGSQPTPTPVPPTPTPVPPTPTPVPPTPTPVPPTATPELPRRILFIGDSYTFWLDQHLKNLAASEDPPLVIETLGVTSGGASLEEHWKLTLGLKAIREGNWDVVVLQEDLSQYWSQLDKFYDYAGKFDEEIHTVLYMPQPWMRKTDPLVTTEDCAAVYSELGEELGAKVAPAALAWQRSIQQRPDLELYAPDGVHGNLRGTYLSLCVIYATIFERNPVGLSYHYSDVPQGSQENIMRRIGYAMTDFTPISEEEAAFLQRIAWETVQDYEQPQP